MKILHYTRFENFEKIVKPNSKLTFHMSDCRLVNDPSEMEVYINYLIKHSSEIKKNLNNQNASVFDILVKEQKELFNHDKWKFGISYIWSLTTRYDSALYWNSKYADSNGVAFVFDNDKLIDYFNELKLEDRFREVTYIDHDINSHFHDKIIAQRFNKMVDYDLDVNEVYKLDRYQKKAMLAILIINEGAFYKHISWNHENEWRLVIDKDVKPKSIINETQMNITTKHQYDESTRFKTIRNTLLPYEEMVVPHRVLSKILLGPSCTLINKEILENYLHFCGVTGVDVEISKCPIRSVG